MKTRLFLIISLAAGLLSTFSVAAKEEPSKPSLKEALLKRNGGTIIQPNTGSGRIVYVNAQKSAPSDWLEENAEMFAKELCLEIDVKEGGFTFPSPIIEGNATLFIIDDPLMPSLLHAPEQRWTIVNLAPLKTGRGKESVFFKARVQKELTRGFALLAGTQTSNYPNSLLGNMTKPEELDTFANANLPVDIKRRFIPYLEGFGITPYIKTTYRRACREGWAPAPTNDIQKAIWYEIKGSK